MQDHTLVLLAVPLPTFLASDIKMHTSVPTFTAGRGLKMHTLFSQHLLPGGVKM